MQCLLGIQISDILLLCIIIFICYKIFHEPFNSVFANVKSAEVDKNGAEDLTA